MGRPVVIGAAESFRRIVGVARDITVAFYYPALDLSGATTVHGDPQDTTGHHGPKRGEYQATGDGGEVRVTRTTWYVDCERLSGRPPMKSLIVDGSDTWIIDDTGPDAVDEVFAFRCTLKG